MPYDAEASARRRRWVIGKNGPLSWRSWDDGEYVVYSPAAGDTHLINEFTAGVLRQLERSDLEFADLARNVARSLGTELDEQTETQVARLLVYLDQIGLVEAVP
jgi:PqqD family protein of HPr-rel-A system